MQGCAPFKPLPDIQSCYARSRFLSLFISVPRYKLHGGRLSTDTCGVSGASGDGCKVCPSHSSDSPAVTVGSLHSSVHWGNSGATAHAAGSSGHRGRNGVMPSLEIARIPHPSQPSLATCALPRSSHSLAGRTSRG